MHNLIYFAILNDSDDSKIKINNALKLTGA